LYKVERSVIAINGTYKGSLKDHYIEYRWQGLLLMVIFCSYWFTQTQFNNMESGNSCKWPSNMCNMQTWYTEK